MVTLSIWKKDFMIHNDKNMHKINRNLVFRFFSISSYIGDEFSIELKLKINIDNVHSERLNIT